VVGESVVRLRVPDRRDLGQEFFRWEFAVATSGMILGINPYDQPDVELAKQLAKSEMARPAATGAADGPPTVAGTDPAAVAAAVRSWMGLCRPGDYVGIQAYLAPSAATSSLLDDLRRKLLLRLRVATTLGYGPRFLHSTGQLHKGGPNTGLFLQIVDSPTPDVPVPGAAFTFGQLIRAQAVGDYKALLQKGRRVLRVDMEADVPGGLRRLAGAVDG
jgi:transaldolase/glucose-6-phosphate isomerase